MSKQDKQPVEAIGAGREEIDLYDDKVQEGIAWTMRQWGEALGLETWTQGDGSESVEGDVGAEIHTILVDAGLRDPETNEIAALSPASPARTPMGGRVDGHGGVTWPAASADLAREEGFESVDMLVDKARIGVNLMERLPEGYAYSDCPTEIVTDLQNKLDEAKTPMGREVEALLRKALEPFARAAGKLDGLWDEEDWRWNDSVCSNVTVRDLRRAAQALAASSPSPAQGEVIADLQEVYQHFLDGDLFEDYDRATELLGKMRRAISTFRIAAARGKSQKTS